MLLSQHIVNCIRERGWIVTKKGSYENVVSWERFTIPDSKDVFVIRTKHAMIRVTHDAVRKHCGIAA